MIRIIAQLTLIALIALTSACTHIVTVDVSAIVDPAVATSKPGQSKYVLSPSANTTKDDLFFKEYSHYFIQALDKNGFTQADDRASADMEIVFSYGLSDGRSGIYTYATPIYEFIGGETINITQKSSDPTVAPTTTTIHIPARYERIGTNLESQEYTYYVAFATLEARSIAKQGDTDTAKILWKVQLQSNVSTNDLRKIMPYMAYAATPYIGKNSGHQISVPIKQNDPKVINSQAFQHK